MNWKHPSNRELPDIGAEVVAVPHEGGVTIARRNEGYWWTDVLAGEDMQPPSAWIEKPPQDLERNT